MWRKWSLKTPWILPKISQLQPNFCQTLVQLVSSPHRPGPFWPDLPRPKRSGYFRGKTCRFESTNGWETTVGWKKSLYIKMCRYIKNKQPDSCIRCIPNKWYYNYEIIYVYMNIYIYNYVNYIRSIKPHQKPMYILFKQENLFGASTGFQQKKTSTASE